MAGGSTKAQADIVASRNGYITLSQVTGADIPRRKLAEAVRVGGLV